MTTITKSVTRLLAERKALEGRITRATSATFIGVQKGTRTPEPVGYSGRTVEHVSGLCKGNLDKVRALIAYYRRITAAIIKSNAAVTVTIGGENMTVAEAIERKTSIVFEKTLLATAIQQARNNQASLDTANAVVDAAIERQLISLFSGDKAKLTAEARKETTDAINAAQRQSPIDPNNLANFAAEQLEKLSQFEVEVDFVLSEINAKTDISIDDEDGPTAPAPVKDEVVSNMQKAAEGTGINIPDDYVPVTGEIGGSLTGPQ